MGGVGLSFLPFSALLHPQRLLKTQSSLREGLQAFGQAAGVGCVGSGCGGILASEPLRVWPVLPGLVPGEERPWRGGRPQAVLAEGIPGRGCGRADALALHPKTWAPLFLSTLPHFQNHPF